MENVFKSLIAPVTGVDFLVCLKCVTNFTYSSFIVLKKVNLSLCLEIKNSEHCQW